VRITVVAGRDASANFDMQSLASLLHGDQVRVRGLGVQGALPCTRAAGATTRPLRRKLRWYEGVG